MKTLIKINSLEVIFSPIWSVPANCRDIIKEAMCEWWVCVHSYTPLSIGDLIMDLLIFLQRLCFYISMHKRLIIVHIFKMDANRVDNKKLIWYKWDNFLLKRSFRSQQVEQLIVIQKSQFFRCKAGAPQKTIPPPAQLCCQYKYNKY